MFIHTQQNNEQRFPHTHTHTHTHNTPLTLSPLYMCFIKMYIQYKVNKYSGCNAQHDRYN